MRDSAPVSAAGLEPGRQIFAPDLRSRGPFPEAPSRAPMIAALTLVIFLGLSGGLFALYGGLGPLPLLAADPGPYRVALGQSAAPPPSGMIDLRPSLPPEASPSEPSRATGFGGTQRRAWLAQVAALRSEEAAGEAWRRLTARDPRLFAALSPDVQRADLGGRGVYFRLRAGYFDDQDAAGRFCEQVRAMGQDCIVVRR